MGLELHAVYIGWPKCASTWFHRFCEASPELAVSRAKDTRYFSANYSKGLEWFFSQLDVSNAKVKAVDINHDYVFSPKCLQNIKETAPDVKIIVFLRHPIDWLISEYNYVSAVANVRSDFDKYLKDYAYAKEYCDFEMHLSEVFKVFRKDQIFVGFLETLKEDAFLFSRALSAFLEISDEFLVHFEAETKVNPRMEPKNRFVPWLTKNAKRTFQMFALDDLYGRMKRGKLRSLLFKAGSESNSILEAKVRLELIEWATEKRRGLERVIGFDVDHWRAREDELKSAVGEENYC